MNNSLLNKKNKKVVQKYSLFEPIQPEKDLDGIFEKYGASKFKLKNTGVYHSFFKNIRKNKNTLLELGIGTLVPDVYGTMNGVVPEKYKAGCSLYSWSEYFKNSLIYGIDNQSDCQININNIKSFKLNLKNNNHINNWMKNNNLTFDIIIDDSSIEIDDHKRNLANFYPRLNSKGYYLIQNVTPGKDIIYPNFFKDQMSEDICKDSFCFVIGPPWMIVISKK